MLYHHAIHCISIATMMEERLVTTHQEQLIEEVPPEGLKWYSPNETNKELEVLQWCIKPFWF